MGPREQKMRAALEARFQPEYFELVNESHMHSVPPGSETHFRLVLVAKVFEGQSRVDRSRLVNSLFADEMKQGLHALTMRTMTPPEWEKVRDTFVMASPECRGGGKRPS